MRKLFDKKIQSITKAALVLSLFSLSSRLLGMVRDRILAGKFGAGNILDIYYASFQIPNFIANLLILGTLSVAFIPVFTQSITKASEGLKSNPSSRKERNKVFSDSWEMANTILNFSCIAILLIYIVIFLAAPHFIHYIAPGFSGEKKLQTLTMTRIMLLSPVFFCLSSIISSILYSFKCFIAVALAPIFYNLGIIFGALVLTKFFGMYGLGVGVILGAFMHLCVQIPTARNLGFIYLPKMNFKNRGVREIGRLFLPRIFGIDSSQISLLIGSIIGSTLSQGSITIYNLSNNIQSIPVGLFGISFALAAFPALSEAASKKNKGNLIQCFSETARKVLFLVIPSMVLIIVLRNEIVTIILGTGKFSSTNVMLSATALSIFCLSLFSQCLMPLISRTFYSLHNTVIPVSTSIFCMFVNVAASLYFISLIKKGNILYNFFWSSHSGSDIRIIGLVLAFTLSSWLNFIILIVFLRKKIGKIGGRKITVSVSKFLPAALGAGFVSFFVLSQLKTFFLKQNFMEVLFFSSITAISGILCYGIILYFLRSEELKYFILKVKFDN